MLILGIDVGTSAVKAAVIDSDTGLCDRPSVSVNYDIDQTVDGAAEIRPDHLWQRLTEAVHSATSDFGDQIAGIGLSCLTPCLCLLDRDEKPLGAFRTHWDRRSRAEARRVNSEVGPEFLATAGNSPLPGGISALSFAQWRLDNPSMAEGVRHYLHLNSWIAKRLGGELAFDPANASFTGLWNTTGNRQWSATWCEYFHVDRDWLPPVSDGRSIVGRLSKEAASTLSLRSGIPIALGTADTSCGMIAARLKPGELYHSVGTTQVLAALVNRPAPNSRRLTRHFGVGDMFVHVAHNPVGGAALTWLHRLCFADISQAKFFGELVPAAVHRPTTVKLSPPFLGGDRLCLEEATAAFAKVTLATDRMDLLAAVLAGMRDGHRQALADLGVAGPFSRVVLAGGGAEIVRMFIPDYADGNVEILEDGAVRGAALLFAA